LEEALDVDPALLTERIAAVERGADRVFVKLLDQRLALRTESNPIAVFRDFDAKTFHAGVSRFEVGSAPRQQRWSFHLVILEGSTVLWHRSYLANVSLGAAGSA